MADQRITQLTKLAQADVAANDVLAIVDVGSSITKKVEAKELFQAGANLADSASIDLIKLNQSSTTKLGTTALADDAVTAAKLADDSSIVYDSVAPSTNNFEGRGYVNSTSKNLQVWNGSSFDQVVAPTAGIENLAVTTGKLAANAVTTAKVDAAGLAAAALATDSVITAKIQDGACTESKLGSSSVTEVKLATGAVTENKIGTSAVTYAKIQNVSATDKLLGRFTAGAGNVEEITCTAAGRALLDDADATAQRTTLGLGNIATQAASAVAITGGTINGITSLTSTTSALGNTTITGGTITGITDLAVADGGTGASNASNARANLGLAIGTDVQAQDAGLQSIAGLTTGVDQTIYTTASDTYAVASLTAYGRSLIDDADAATARTTLGLGTLATQSATVTGTHSGTSSGSNTGDQTITLTGAITGTGTGSFATAITASAVTENAIATNAVTTGKILDDAITAAKLADDSTTIVQAGTPSGSGAFEGQLWFDTNTSVKYVWNGAAWIRQAAINAITFSDTTPLNFSVAYPDNHSAVITTTLDTQVANRALLGPLTGADAAPTFRDIEPGDLPDATGSTKGIIQPGTGLAVNAGVLNHSNSATAGTFTKVTIDTQGHVTVGALLDAADVPVLDAAKITTGELPTARVADNAITSGKLADYSTASIGEGLPVADFIGQIHLNPLDRAFFMWDGNVYVPIGISAGQIIFAGTFDASDPASRGKVASVTPEGAAAGFTVGSALPASSLANNRHYLVVSEGGTLNTGNAPHVTLAPPDLILSVYSTTSPAWVEIDVSSGAGAIAASQVSFTAIGDIAATNVQTAIEEVSTECRNATNITSGTLAVARGGTNVASYTKGDLLAASASTTLTKLPVGTNGQVLRANSATATGLEYGADFVGTVTTVTSSTAALTVATATTTPALTVRAATTSVDGIVQLSDSISTTSSVLAATPTAVKSAYDLAALALPAAGGTVTGELLIGSAGTLVFEGSTSDGNETTLAVADPTADRTITLPNVTGTVVTTGDSGTVTSTMIADGTIVNADVNTSAAIAGTKVSPDFGSQTVVTTGVFSHALGAVGTPSITFTGDLNTGFWSPTADTLAASTAGTERLRITAAGLVGIGTSSPGKTLDVTGTARVSSILTMGSYIQGTIQLDLYGDSTSSSGVRLDSSGRLGIGTTSPATTLDVNGDVTITDKIIHGGDTNTAIRFPAADTVTVETAGSERARIDSSGRLLVGTSTARTIGTLNHGLQIESSTTGLSRASFYLNQASDTGPGLTFGKSRGASVGSSTIVQNNDYLGYIAFVGANGVDSENFAASIGCLVDGTPGIGDMPGRLEFSTTADGASSPTERMRIVSSGQSLWGTTSTTGNAFASTATFGLAIDPSNGQILNCANGGPAGYFNRTGDDGGLFVFNRNGTQVGNISVTTAATTYNSVSDYRLKENVEPITGAAARILQLKPSRFNFIVEPDKTVDGFLAHEAQAVVPECVTGEKDAVDVDGNPVYQGIDQSKLVPLLTAALQEAIAKIETLEARLTTAGIE